MTLRTDFTNETDSTDTHPAAHNDTNTQVNANTDAIAALAVDATRKRIAPAGYFFPAYPLFTNTTAGQAAGTLKVTRCSWDVPIDALAANCTVVAAGATATAVVYAMLPTGLPGALLAQSAAVEASGTAGQRLFTLPAPVAAGAYWAGLLMLGAQATWHVDNATNPYVAVEAISKITPGYCGYQRTGLAAVPDPYGATVVGVGTVPLLAARIAP